MAVINGGGGSDTISGTRNADLIRGLAGRDILSGAAGADTVFGGLGPDNVSTGYDSGRRLGDTLFGGAGADEVIRFNRQESGTGATDFLYGGTGADWLRVNGSRNGAVLDGGGGRDRLSFDFTRTPEDAFPDDRGLAPITVFGGAGDDFVEVQSFRGLSVSAGTGDDFVDLTAGAGPGDWIAPQGSIAGGSGTDLLVIGGLGDLTVDFSAGRNLVRSSAFDALNITGFERIGVRAGDGDDSVIGGNGDDQIDVGAGQNTVSAGAGNDTVWVEGLGQNHSLDGGDGQDVLNVTFQGETTYDANVIASAGLTTAGFERLNVYAGSDIATNVRLGSGDDLFLGFRNNEGVDTVIPSLTSFDTVFGRGGADVLYGGDAADQLYGGQQNDILGGGAGIDYLFGDRGDDTIDGGEGPDLLYGGLGNDLLSASGRSGKQTGGDGADTFAFQGNAPGAFQITDFEAGDGDLIDLSAIGDLLAGAAIDLVFVGSDNFSRTAGEVRSYSGPLNTTIAVDRDGNGASDLKLVLLGIQNFDSDSLIL